MLLKLCNVQTARDQIRSSTTAAGYVTGVSARSVVIFRREAKLFVGFVCKQLFLER